MSGGELVVGVAGATGALGKEILAVLDKAPWRPARVVPLASARSQIPFASWGEEQVAVDDVANADLEAMDLLFCAMPDDASTDLITRARDADVPVVDCSRSRAGDADVPCVIPWINPQHLEERPPIVRIPSSAAILLASLLGPVARAGLSGEVDATMLVPASAWGRDGIDELSRQVTALFNSATPPRKVFPGGLAFDLAPVVGTLGPDGWTDREREVASEAAAVSAWEGDVRVTLIGVPVFSGLSVQLRWTPSRQAPRELIDQILVDGGVRRPEGEGARRVPRPRRLDGQPFAQFDRVRVDSAGGVHLWAVSDNLRSAAAVAVSTGGVMVRWRAGQ